MYKVTGNETGVWSHLLQNTSQVNLVLETKTNPPRRRLRGARQHWAALTSRVSSAHYLPLCLCTSGLARSSGQTLTAAFGTNVGMVERDCRMCGGHSAALVNSDDSWQRRSLLSRRWGEEGRPSWAAFCLVFCIFLVDRLLENTNTQFDPFRFYWNEMDNLHRTHNASYKIYKIIQWQVFCSTVNNDTVETDSILWLFVCHSILISTVFGTWPQVATVSKVELKYLHAKMKCDKSGKILWPHK